MKKKLIAGLTSAAMLASLTAPAFAANFQDVKGTSSEKAAGLLKALGVVNGDVNGNFNPNATITRAEFAKIAVLLAGYKNAADAYGTNVTPFSSDVKAGHWAAGYIQVAKDTGLVKGYDEWNFGPSDNVKYEEVLAVALRILGYNDSLPGSWPSDYVIKGTQLKLNTNTAFSLGKAATRGDVAMIAAAALSQEAVVYSKDLDSFLGTSLDLIDKNFGTAVTATRLLTLNADDEAVFEAVDADGLPITVSYEVAADASIVGAASVDALFGHSVKFVKDADDKIVYLADEVSASKVVTGKADGENLAAAGGFEFTGSTTTITPAANALYYVNGYKVLATDTRVTTVAAGSEVTVIKDANGNGSAYFVNKYDLEALVNSVTVTTTTTKLNYFIDDQFTVGASKNFADDAKVFINGVAAKATDLKKGDAIYVVYTEDGSEVAKVEAYNTKVTGKVSKVVETATSTKITVNGTEYVVDTALVTAVVPFDTEGDVTYEFTLGKKNEIVAAKEVAGESNTVTGYVVNVVGKQLVQSDNTLLAVNQTTIFTTAGETKVYNVPTSSTVTPVKDDFIKAVFDKDGKLTTDSDITVTDGTLGAYQADVIATDIDTTNSRIEVGSRYIPVNSSTVFVDISADANADGVVEPKLTSLDKLAVGATFDVVYAADGVTAKYVLVSDSGAAEIEVPDVTGVYVSEYTQTVNGTPKYYVTLNVNGTDTTFEYEDNTFAATANQVVVLDDADKDGKYLVNALKVNSVTIGASGVNTTAFTFADATNTYVVNSNTVVYLLDPADGKVKIGNFYDIENGATVDVVVGTTYNTTKFEAKAVYVGF